MGMEKEFKEQSVVVNEKEEEYVKRSAQVTIGPLGETPRNVIEGESIRIQIRSIARRRSRERRNSSRRFPPSWSWRPAQTKPRRKPSFEQDAFDNSVVCADILMLECCG